MSGWSMVEKWSLAIEWVNALEDHEVREGTMLTLFNYLNKNGHKIAKATLRPLF